MSNLLLIKIWEQFYLVTLSVSIAIAIGLPLGIVIKNFKKTKAFILAVAGALWTIPSLALLALFIPVMGIGIKPAIVVLSIYAILPILRNTVVGLDSVPPETIEAAVGLGFTRWQKLWMVEMPLAMSVIIAGIRISVAMCIGVATLAAFIGAGGLGDFINQGLALNNTHLILLGAIPAALMALVLDYLIAAFEMRIRRPAGKVLSGVVLIFMVGVILFLVVSTHAENKNTVRIATKNFTEQIILGELMSQIIEAKTKLHVVRKFNLGTTAICQSAMINDEIDMYPEYTGTAYLTILHLHGILAPNQIFTLVRDEYKKQFNLIWLNPFGFNNSQALAVNPDFSARYHLHNISDLIPIEGQIILGAPAEFTQREDGLIGLMRVYHLRIGQIRQMDPGLMYNAIKAGEVNMINAFSTDARIPAYHLILLNDDKHFYPAYQAAPVIRADILQKHPEILSALTPLLGSISDNDMRGMNYQADIQHQTPYVVANTYLKSHHLIQ